ncbi:MAG TPA: c-type cytochrome [Solirubrobacteraceae bacterium]|nr:c-type cytochrome [Solirubrobacteraceae bacterium]
MPRLTARERREAYLREYAYQKRLGKPFFPGALLHDTLVNFFFIALIIGLTCLWYFTAGHGHDLTHGGSNGVLGPLYEDRADPAVESYDPRPEWYYFFLFELLRIFGNPNVLLLGTIIVPTIFMVVLLAIPFIDRTRERRLSHRPVAISFASGMAVLLLALTWYGSKAPGAAGTSQSPEGVLFASQQCASCHTLKDAGTTGNVGPNLDSAHPNYQTALDFITNGKDGMPSFKGTYSAAKIKCLATYVSSITNGGNTGAPAGGAPTAPSTACKGIS